jgi:4-hydroxyacetophenone monooxygenase
VSLAHATGDLALLREELKPDQTRLIEPDLGYTPEQIAAACHLGAEALDAHLEAGRPHHEPTADELRQLLQYLVGDAVGEYLPLLVEELGDESTDLRSPTWHKDEVAPDTDFTVAIIGAGMSGLVAAHRLQQAGVPFVILEKNEDVGGTWFENVYPGCRVDVPNHLYSYSFAQHYDWPQFYSSQDVLLDYFRRCADEFGLRDHIRFSTEVVDAVFDEGTSRWRLHLRSPDGDHEILADAVVSAVGQLNRPHWPEIPGQERFAGPSFHSAEWRRDVPLAGRRVGVIGTGASAVQFIPEVAQEAASTIVFQRTPPWLVPTPEYHEALPAGLDQLRRDVPEFGRWTRLWLFWRMHEGMLPAVRVDPDWPHQERSVSAANDFIREMLTGYLRMEFPDDELFEKVLPHYPPAAKRVVRDNGIWARTLNRDDTTLITTGIAEITEAGVRTVDGVEHEVDVLIYGTGFRASQFLVPMRVTGRDGVELHDWWDGEARAYLGITVPGFPNLFLMYGPNTNIVINGSIIYFSECETHYILESIRMLLATGHRTMDCRPDVHDAYNAAVDEENRQMAWGASSVNTWYKNASGRVSQNWPYSLLEYWRRTRQPDPEDYVLR